MDPQLAAFLPEMVVQHISQVSGPVVTAPRSYSFDTVVLFADVAKFSVITEQLAQQGPSGIEELGYCLNRYMERLVRAVTKGGGEVFKFAGDAVLVLWPPDAGDAVEEVTPETEEGLEAERPAPPSPGGNSARQMSVLGAIRRTPTLGSADLHSGGAHGDALSSFTGSVAAPRGLGERVNPGQRKRLLRAAQTALRIQEELNNIEFRKDIKFSVKIGIGFGRRVQPPRVPGERRVVLRSLSRRGAVQARTGRRHHQPLREPARTLCRRAAARRQVHAGDGADEHRRSRAAAAAR
jgi:class 3 adenylate cyclase